MLELVADLGYQPELVVQPRGLAEGGAERVDLALLPSEFAFSLAEARRTGRPLFIEFSGPD